VAFTKVDVLVDSKAGDLSIISVDDSDGSSVETTLSVAEAWSLICDLNEAIHKLAQATIPETSVCTPVINKPTVVHTHYNIDARGASNSAQVEIAVRAAMQQGSIQSQRRPERVRDAVLEAVGADGVRKERYSKPGFPATIETKGLREYVEPVDVT
jgi:hypothetical protein